MKWPPQDTGKFAVPFCVQCCTYVPPDMYEISGSVNTLYRMVGAPNPDGSATALYRTVTWSGGFIVNYSSYGDCSVTGATSTSTYSGSSTKNFDLSVTGALQAHKNGTLFADTNVDSPYLVPPSGMPDDTTGASTATAETITGSGECYLVAGGAGLYPFGVANGTATAAYSNPCTEEASIAWFVAANPGWNAWSTAYMDAYWDYFWVSAYQPSAPGVADNRTHQRMRFRRTKGGYTPGTSYVCQMQVERSAYSGGGWALYATMETTLVADTTGLLVWEGEIPFTRGYQTWVKARSFTATPA